MLIRFQVHIHSLYQLILCVRCFKCLTTANMLVFWSSCLYCLPLCLSNFNGCFGSQGKYRATYEFKSSGCALSNNLIHDSSLILSVLVKVTQCASPSPPPPSCRRGGGIEPSTKFKKGGLDRTPTFRGGLLGKMGRLFFRGGGVIVT